jgi:hypothetical protein
MYLVGMSTLLFLLSLGPGYHIIHLGQDTTHYHLTWHLSIDCTGEQEDRWSTGCVRQRFGAPKAGAGFWL